MKFKFIDSNNKTDLSHLNLDHIYLSTQNPRYTTLNSIDDNLLDKIRDINSKTQAQVLLELLSSEGDFADLKNLLISIRDIGFNSLGENILLAKVDDTNYSVAEGNRRTMALKLIEGGEEWVMPEIDKIPSINTKEILISEDDREDDSFEEKRKYNYNSILELLVEIRNRHKEFPIYVEIVEDVDSLWKLIYTKHIAGERPGMRQWTRGKYFTDILSFFKGGISQSPEINYKIRSLLQREPSIVIDDFKLAQFAKEVIKNGTQFTEEPADAEIYEIMRNIKVSALQPNFSVKRISDSADKFLNIDPKTFRSLYFDYSYNEKNLINFNVEGKKVQPTKILRFIDEYFKRGFITTRPIKVEKQGDFNLAVKKLLSVTDIDTKKVVSEEKLKQIDSFDYSIKELNEIIYNAKDSHVNDEVIARFEATKNIKEDSAKIIDLLKTSFNVQGDEPMGVFNKLMGQYKHNQIDNIFLNATAATLRSILEQLIIWGSFYYEDAIHDVINTSDSLSNKKNAFAKELASGKIHKIFSQIWKTQFEKMQIDFYLSALTKTSKKSVVDFIFNNKGDIDSLLNEFIHASHRIYNQTEFSNNLTKFSKWQKNLIEILEDLDYSKFEDLNNLIKSKIL